MRSATTTQPFNERANWLADGYKLLDVRAVAGILGVHPATVWRKSANGSFPAPIKVAGLTRWRLSDIEAAISEVA